MATWECAECTAIYSVGAPECPQCGSTVRVNEATQPPEEEQDMAKITVHGGASNANEDLPAEGGEDVSAGTDSSTSSEQEQSSPEPSETSRRKPARGAASRSSQGPKVGESSTADSTATSGRETAADGK